MKVKSDNAVNFLFKQLEGRSLKNIRASTGFEPVNSAIPGRCSTKWAVKPHVGSEVNLLNSCLPVQWNDVKYICMKCILYFGCRWKWRVIIASSCQLLKLEIYCNDHRLFTFIYNRSTIWISYIFHIFWNDCVVRITVYFSYLFFCFLTSLVIWINLENFI